MPVKRRASKMLAHRVTPEAVEAYAAGDYAALHRELSLAPWQCSPLPSTCCALGCDQGEAPDHWAQPHLGWNEAQALQVQLEAECCARGLKSPGAYPSAVLLAGSEHFLVHERFRGQPPAPEMVAQRRCRRASSAWI